MPTFSFRTFSLNVIKAWNCTYGGDIFNFIRAALLRQFTLRIHLLELCEKDLHRSSCFSWPHNIWKQYQISWLAAVWAGHDFMFPHYNSLSLWPGLLSNAGILFHVVILVQEGQLKGCLGLCLYSRADSICSVSWNIDDFIFKGS